MFICGRSNKVAPKNKSNHLQASTGFGRPLIIASVSLVFCLYFYVFVQVVVDILVPTSNILL